MNDYLTCPFCAQQNYKTASQCAYCGRSVVPCMTNPAVSSFPPREGIEISDHTSSQTTYVRHEEPPPKATAGVKCVVCLRDLGDAEGWVQVRDGQMTARGKHERCEETTCHPCGRKFVPNDRNLPSSAIYCSARCAWS